MKARWIVILLSVIACLIIAGQVRRCMFLSAVASAVKDSQEIIPGEWVESLRQIEAFDDLKEGRTFFFCRDQGDYETAEFIFKEERRKRKAFKLYARIPYKVLAVDGGMVQVEDEGGPAWTAARWLHEVSN